MWTAGQRDVMFSVAAPGSEPQRVTLAEGFSLAMSRLMEPRSLLSVPNNWRA